MTDPSERPPSARPIRGAEIIVTANQSGLEVVPCFSPSEDLFLRRAPPLTGAANS
jgi:hypothetical protein